MPLFQIRCKQEWLDELDMRRGVLDRSAYVRLAVEEKALRDHTSRVESLSSSLETPKLTPEEARFIQGQIVREAMSPAPAVPQIRRNVGPKRAVVGIPKKGTKS